MLKLYDHLENSVEEHNRYQYFAEARLSYLVSEIMETLDIEDADEIALSLNRTFQACNILQLPLNRNFKRVYRSDGVNMLLDWKISPLACYLIIINCNPIHKHVAKAQLYFAMNYALKK